MDLKEKTLSSKTVYDGTFLKVQKDEVQLPDGKTTIREYIVHPGAAMIVPVLPNGKLLMIRQFRYPLKRVFIEFPAGKTDAGEDSLQTAKRELEEETGCEAKIWRLMTTIHPVIGYADEKIDLFLAQDIVRQRKNHLDPEEFLELVEYSLPEAMDLMKKGQITDVKTMVGLFWLQQLQSGGF